MPKVILLDTTKLIELYEQGLSVRFIGKMFEVSAGTIKARFAAAGYKLRKDTPLNYQERLAKERQMYQDPLVKAKRLSNRKRWGTQNRVKVAANMVVWNSNNRNHVLKYREDTKELLAQRVKEYRASTHGKSVILALRHSRRILEGTFSILTPSKITHVFEGNALKYGVLTCELCFEPIRDAKASLEHFIPITRYKDFPDIDLNASSNLGVAHLSCNINKKAKTLSEWFQTHSKYLINGINKGLITVKPILNGVVWN